MPVSGQLSLFGVEAHPPVPADLEGLLIGPGQVVRLGGTARVSVVVDSGWRVRALFAECAARSLVASWEPAAVAGHYGVRTAYSAALAPLAVAWLRGAAVKQPPAEFALDGPRLRLWAVAAGSAEDREFTLRLGVHDNESCWKVAGAGLAALGLAAAWLGPRSGGPAYRIAGRRRLARLAELIGEPPAAAPPTGWPAA
jgi:hypothetical protein